MRKLIFSLLAAAFAFAPSQAPAHGIFNFWHKHASHSYVGKAGPIGHIAATVVNRFGVPVAYHDLGYGTITDLAVDSMANDGSWWVTSNVPNNTLTTEKYCATGTGTTASAATDLALQTPDSVTPVAGTQTYSLIPNAASYKVVCTLSYSGTEAVTEFELANSGTLSTSFTTSAVGTNNTAVFAASTFTASSTTVQGEQQFVADDTTLSCYAFITSNSTTTLTVGNLGSGTDQWYNNGARTTCSSGGHTFPQSGDTVKILALADDHLVFAVINVVSGDSIQFTFTESLPSGS